MGMKKSVNRNRKEKELNQVKLIREIKRVTYSNYMRVGIMLYLFHLKFIKQPLHIQFL